MGEAVATLKGPGPGPADGTKTLDGVDAALGTGTDTDVGKDVGIDEATAAPAPEIPNILPPLLSFRSNNALAVTGPPTPPAGRPPRGSSKRFESCGARDRFDRRKCRW